MSQILSIIVNIAADKQSATIIAGGLDVHPYVWEDGIITPEILSTGAAKYIGQSPDSVYTCDPNDQGTPFQDNKVVSVQTQTSVCSSEIVQFNNTVIDHAKQNRLDMQWNTDSFEVPNPYALDISYSVNLGPDLVNFTQLLWPKSIPYDDGTAGPAEVISILASVSFVVTLGGYMMANYTDPYQGHHFHFQPVDTIIKSSGLGENGYVLNLTMTVEVYLPT